MSSGKLDDAHKISDEVSEGTMALWDYLILHPEAKLSSAEKQTLITGMQKTFAGAIEKRYESEKEDENHDEEDDESEHRSRRRNQ